MTGFRRLVGTGFAITVIAASLPLAACGGGGDDGTGDLSGAINQQPTQAAVRQEVVIEVKESSFSPDSVTVKTGSKVIWKWVSTPSCAIQYAGSTGPQQTSGTYERIFDQTGSSFTYQCANNPAMTGRIAIE